MIAIGFASNTQNSTLSEFKNKVFIFIILVMMKSSAELPINYIRIFQTYLSCLRNISNTKQLINEC